MIRREFITLLRRGAAASPVVARAPPRAQVPHLGVAVDFPYS